MGRGIRAIAVAMLMVLPILALADHEYHFKKHLTNSGAQELVVYQTYQASSGFVYLGTNNGFYRYDGKNITDITFADSAHSHEIRAIEESPNGTIWIGNEAGQVFVMKGNKLHQAAAYPDTIDAGISDILIDEKGFIWVGTKGEGLLCYKDDKWERLQAPADLSDNYINDLETYDRQIWVATDRGINIFDGDADHPEVQKITATQRLPDNIILSLEASPEEGMMWIGSHSKGFFGYAFDSASFFYPKAMEQWNYGPVNDLLAYEPGILWIGTNGQGIVEWNKAHAATLHQLYYEKNLSDSRIFDLTLDRECNAWIATNDQGLLTANKKIAIVGMEQADQKVANVLSIHADEQGYLWYSTNEGLFGFDPLIGDSTAFHQYDVDEMEPGDLIISIFSTGPGELWLGTFGNGLYYFNLNTGRQFHLTKANALINDNILSISGNDDTLWLATLGGASRCVLDNPIRSENDLSFTHYDHQNGLGTNYIYQVYIDSRGNKWFATDGEGITRLSNDEFTTFDKRDGLDSDVIYSITEDHSGNIWFSTPDQGIYKYDGQSFVNYGLENGLRDLNITSLVTDKYGRIVIINEEGLDILNPANDHLSYIGEGSGITDFESDLNDFSVDRENNIWIGTQQGVVKYAPPPHNCRSQPLTVLKEVKIFLKDIALNDAREVNYNNNHFTFEFAGLWYQGPSKVRYQYKLEGYDLDWNSTKDESVIYPSLDPGSYTFHVRSSIDNNFNNASELTYQFEINPPFYQTPWFIVSLLIVIILSIYWYIQSREKRVKALERLEKEKVDFQFQTLRSQVNPHFLFNSFNTLLNIIDVDQKAASEYVERLSDFFRNLLTYRQQEVISLSDELKMLEDYYFLQRKRYGENFTLTIDIEEPENYFIPPMTLQLLVENALKHNVISKNNPLYVAVSKEGNELVVKNNLQRKREVEKSTRVGLSNVLKRYQILFDKEIEVFEEDNYFIVKLPLIKN